MRVAAVTAAVVIILLAVCWKKASAPRLYPTTERYLARVIENCQKEGYFTEATETDPGHWQLVAGPKFEPWFSSSLAKQFGELKNAKTVTIIDSEGKVLYSLTLIP